MINPVMDLISLPKKKFLVTLINGCNANGLGKQFLFQMKLRL